MSTIHNLMDLLDRMSKEALRSENDTLLTSYGELKKELFIVFPQIIGIYSDERMRDLAGDAVYWPQQLQRIIDAFEANDYLDLFYIYDVLKSETLANIKELVYEMDKRGISCD